MVKNVIFICGLGGDAGMTYVENLKKFCNSKGMRLFAPHMPSYEDGISYQKYLESFENLLRQENIDFGDTLLICHSAGTNFAVKYFSHSPAIFKGYISVSGFSREPDRPIIQGGGRLQVLETFYATNQEYEDFKNLKFPKFSIYGGKDCLFTLDNLKDYAEKIGAKHYYDPEGVHCTISENVKTHTLLHKVIEQYFT